MSFTVCVIEVMQYTDRQKKKFFIYSNKSKLLYGFSGDHEKMHIFDSFPF